MLFVIGVLIGLIAGIMRTFMPSLGNWGMAIAIGMSSISTNLSIGFLISESCVGGLGSVVGAAYSPNLSNPVIADIDLEDRKEVVEEACGLYVIYKLIPCIGFAILIFFGVGELKIDVWPLSKAIILIFLVPSVLMKVGSRALIPYIGVMMLATTAALILVKSGINNPIYVFFTSVFVIGANLAGFRPMPKQRMITEYEVDYPWAFVTGSLSSVLIGTPAGILLDLSGDKDDAALYKENALASGISEGMGISLFLVGFGSRDAPSSTLSLWMNDAGKWQAIACLGMVMLVTTWYYEAFMDGLIRVFDNGIIMPTNRGITFATICIGTISCLVMTNLTVILMLSCIGFCMWKVMKVYSIETSNLMLIVSLLALFLIG